MVSGSKKDYQPRTGRIKVNIEYLEESLFFVRVVSVVRGTKKDYQPRKARKRTLTKII